jgi:hypothetical protein
MVLSGLDMAFWDILGGTPEAFGNLIKTDVVKWGKVVKDSGAKVD